MSRIAVRLRELRQAGKKALIPYITAGDPRPEVTVQLMHAMASQGADLIELGVPFSDPMADGPVIQAACERALEYGVSLTQVLGLVKQFRDDDKATPVILMGYLNPIEVMGYEAFASRAAAAGVDGVITVDLPPEEAQELLQAQRRAGLDTVMLIAPTSPRSRIEAICEASSGFVYYVSLKGVTGAKTLDADAVAEKLEEIRRCTDLPVGVGFGVRDAASAVSIGRVADAVVVGSAIVQRVADNATDPSAIRASVGELLASMREGLDTEITGAKVA
ncbi:MAG: tryptophan synthase subunit alpha [Gammaproteobacteria bacterium]